MPDEPQTFWRIRNWDRYQHYSSDRFPVPPWIKFYVTTLDEADLIGLPIPSRLLANLLLLVAARLENRIPASAKIVAGYVQLPTKTVTTSLKHLEKIGFLELRSFTDSEQEMARNGQMQLERSRQTLDETDDQSRPHARARTRGEQELKAVRSQRQSSTRPRANSLPSAPLIEKLLAAVAATTAEAGVIRANCRGCADADLGRILEALETGGTKIRNPAGYAVAMLQELPAERDNGEPDL